MYKLISTIALVAASTTATAATPTVNATAKATKDVSALKYCLQMDPLTGSRIHSSECRTKAEWKDLDVDVDELLAKNERAQKTVTDTAKR